MTKKMRFFGYACTCARCWYWRRSSADTSEIYLKTKGFGVTLLPWALSIFALALFLAIRPRKTDTMNTLR
ncbi:hypothetical protein [uncultured Desulfobacter sp.]|uniref:hypothetical protein n=1 Tax=uncultured Desulfobacter sp. TaxID=240139 RepID=UPI0029F585C8|nr:hypothetical protein [uncultured Desulfobacter sp.]